MISFEQVKQITIEFEKEWIKEVEDDGDFGYMQGTVDEINNCKTISDIVDWYGERGYSNEESYECIIANLMTFGSVK